MSRMNATIITIAWRSAIKAVGRDIRAQGLRVNSVERRLIVAAANDYLREHPELIKRLPRLFVKFHNYEH